MIDWKVFVFIALMAFVTADAATNEKTQGRRFAAMIVGLYATGIFTMLLMVAEIKMSIESAK